MYKKLDGCTPTAKKIKIVGISILVVVLVGCFLFWIRQSSAPQLIGKAMWQVDTNEKLIALTFDDGPNPHATEKIVELLKKYDAKATFFVIGENVQKYPELVKKTYENGNEIGNHSWNHSRLIYKKYSFVKEQVESTDEVIKQTGYTGDIQFRAPYGNKFLILPYILKDMDKTHVLYNMVLNDWDSPAPEKMLKQFDKEVQNGSIVLLHDGYTRKYESRENTVKLVEMILDKYTKKGYKFVTISELSKKG
ncbi:polysaccharide deacetylase family protein [Bacillus cereus]|uniref:polysaccharide deacetylase family protein n=1 Tax=Bacillus cereus TaxID=1396 RepID=UPI003012CBB3